jgi:excinuclease ABC subunit B
MPIKSLPACKKTIDETDYRRTKQINFNTANNQVPQALNKKIERPRTLADYELGLTLDTAESETILSKAEIEKALKKRKAMEPLKI